MRTYVIAFMCLVGCSQQSVPVAAVVHQPMAPASPQKPSSEQELLLILQRATASVEAVLGNLSATTETYQALSEDLTHCDRDIRLTGGDVPWSKDALNYVKGLSQIVAVSQRIQRLHDVQQTPNRLPSLEYVDEAVRVRNNGAEDALKGLAARNELAKHVPESAIVPAKFFESRAEIIDPSK